MKRSRRSAWYEDTALMCHRCGCSMFPTDVFEHKETESSVVVYRCRECGYTERQQAGVPSEVVGLL